MSSNSVVPHELVATTGCVSTDPYALTINIDKELVPALPEQKKYAIVYADDASQALVGPHHAFFQQSLEQLGYEKTPQEDVKVAIYVIATVDEVFTETREMTDREMGLQSDPNSIRNKNVAAMTGSSRYQALLYDSSSATGTLMTGPSGQAIVTNNLKDRSTNQRPLIQYLRRISRIVVAAMDIPIPRDPDEVNIRWQIEVLSDLPTHKKAPSAQELVQQAADHLFETQL